jgi:hypothetical protein
VLTTLGLPSEWVWALINDSKIRKNFSASMAWPRWRWFPVDWSWKGVWKFDQLGASAA